MIVADGCALSENKPIPASKGSDNIALAVLVAFAFNEEFLCNTCKSVVHVRRRGFLFLAFQCLVHALDRAPHMRNRNGTAHH